jgi:transposase-like protein
MPNPIVQLINVIYYQCPHCHTSNTIAQEGKGKKVSIGKCKCCKSQYSIADLYRFYGNDHDMTEQFDVLAVQFTCDACGQDKIIKSKPAINSLQDDHTKVVWVWKVPSSGRCQYCSAEYDFILDQMTRDII